MAHSTYSFWGGILKSMGLVFGDIGTSPIYTLTVIFALTEPSRDNMPSATRRDSWSMASASSTVAGAAAARPLQAAQVSSTSPATS